MAATAALTTLIPMDLKQALDEVCRRYGLLASHDAGAELAPEAVLAQLLGCGLLEKVGSLGENRVQFADDPIAEYLMAMSVDHQRTSEWARRLKRELRKAGEKARGLADALADVEAAG